MRLPTAFCLLRTFLCLLPAACSLLPATPTHAGTIDYKSNHFLIHTDLSQREAGKLIGKLEAMVSAMGNYFGQPCRGSIECYVVANLNSWPKDTFSPDVAKKISQCAGVTLTDVHRQDGGKFTAKSVVYAYARGDACVHEAFHAYLGQTFGVVGPVWWAEGMAELARFWKPGDPAVHCPDWVIKQLHSSKAPSFSEIFAEGAETGDSWENYAHRWALCQLLFFNPNYADEFREYSRGIAAGKAINLREAFNGRMNEIETEYYQFVANVAQGYRVDLCRWDWKTPMKYLKPGESTTIKIDAKRGWQAAGVSVQPGQSFDCRASGTWRVSPREASVSADGGPDGKGRLVGMVYGRGFRPCSLGQRGSFTEDSFGGALYLRCNDAWGSLADNQGTITVTITSR